MRLLVRLGVMTKQGHYNIGSITSSWARLAEIEPSHYAVMSARMTTPSSNIMMQGNN